MCFFKGGRGSARMILIQIVSAEKNIYFQVSGKAKFLPNDVPNMIEVVGRIAPDMVWSYIAQMKKSGSKVSVGRLMQSPPCFLKHCSYLEVTVSVIYHKVAPRKG